MLNNIGCLHEYDTDIIHGRKVRYRSQLKENWDIWQTEIIGRDTPPEEFDSLYLYYEGNPNNLRLEFSVADAAVRISNATIVGVRIEGFGFGISASTHTIIKDCELDAIGGIWRYDSNQ